MTEVSSSLPGDEAAGPTRSEAHGSYGVGSGDAMVPPAPDLPASGTPGARRVRHGRVLALVASTRAIEWLCLPRFDALSVLGRLLDAEGGGTFASWRTRRSWKGRSPTFATPTWSRPRYQRADVA